MQAAKTQVAMQYKEELARQELKRVKEAQDKRKCIKAIRFVGNFNSKCLFLFNFTLGLLCVCVFFVQTRSLCDGSAPCSQGTGV